MPSKPIQFLFKAVWRRIKTPTPLLFSLLVLIGILVSLWLGCYIFHSADSKAKIDNSQSDLTKVVRIGYQPHGTMFYLKVRGNLEKRLSRIGFAVKWQKFPAGPPILTAMGEGKIDMGYAGVIPPVFAQAKGIPFVYVAKDSAAPETIGILVHQNSQIRKLADLKGKKITATKASASHYFLIRALIKAGLKLKDIEFVDLPPPQGQIAFKQGKVDAWIGWQPFLAELQASMPVHLLTNGEGLMNDRNFYLATVYFAKSYEKIIKIVIEEAQLAANWANSNPEQVAKIISANTGLKAATALTISKMRRYEAQPIQDRVIEEQQRIAETFFRLGLLPKRIWVEDAVWKRELGKWGGFQ